MIYIIRMSSGDYNILGSVGGDFFLTGNLTVRQLVELRHKVNEAVEEAKRNPDGNQD